jgi:Zn-dependent protease
MASVSPGNVILLGTQRGTFQVKTTADPSNSTHALIGIGLGDAYNAKIPSLSFIQPQTVGEAEFWLANVLISVAFINMLPMPPFDGSKFLDVILDVFRVKRAKEVRITMYAASIALLALNLIISFLRFGFLRY